MLAVVLAWALLASSEDMSERDRQLAMVHYREAQQLMLSERFDLAEREFKAAIALDPLLVEAHYGLGQCYMSQRDFPAAVRAYTGSRTAHKEATVRQAQKALDSERRRREGSQALRDMLAELNRAVANPNLPLSQTQQIRRQIVFAEQNIQQLDRLWGLGSAVDQVPPGISVALGSAYFRCGAFADAEREYLAALAVNPKIGEANNNLAVVYIYLGRIPEAMEQVKRAERNGYKVHTDLNKELGALLHAK